MRSRIFALSVATGQVSLLRDGSATIALLKQKFPKENEMNIYIIWLLRIIHIVAGVFWVGGTLIMTLFVAPTVAATGEAGQRFVGHLMNSLKFSNRMAMASGLTILAGFILYFRGGSAFLESRFGIGLGIGAVFALIGFFFGVRWQSLGHRCKANHHPTKSCE
jgi:hypothetical protein